MLGRNAVLLSRGFTTNLQVQSLFLFLNLATYHFINGIKSFKRDLEVLLVRLGQWPVLFLLLSEVRRCDHHDTLGVKLVNLVILLGCSEVFLLYELLS